MLKRERTMKTKSRERLSSMLLNYKFLWGKPNSFFFESNVLHRIRLVKFDACIRHLGKKHKCFPRNKKAQKGKEKKRRLSNLIFQ